VKAKKLYEFEELTLQTGKFIQVWYVRNGFQAGREWWIKHKKIDPLEHTIIKRTLVKE